MQPRPDHDDREALRLPRRRSDDDGRLVGIVTDGDLRRAMGPDLLARRVGEIMTPLAAHHRARCAGGRGAARHERPHTPITTLFVVDPAGRPIGILHVHDLLRAGLA